jgi:hypothetical protein
MLHEFGLDDEFLALLSWWDGEIARIVAAAGCLRCDGPLHQANYHRKPRGGWIFKCLAAFTLRHSLCCGHCRKRSLPPSVLFLGRRVYIESVVLLACVAQAVAKTARGLAEITGVPVVTLHRWRAWWRESLPVTASWSVLRARFAPPAPDEEDLPGSLLIRIAQDLNAVAPSEATPSAVLLLTARCLAPVTTSLTNAASFVRAVAAQLSSKGLTQKMSIAVGPPVP